jgi:hypothetical protein
MGGFDGHGPAFARLDFVHSGNIWSRFAGVIATSIDGATQLRDDNPAGCTFAVMAGLSSKPGMTNAR